MTWRAAWFGNEGGSGYSVGPYDRQSRRALPTTRITNYPDPDLDEVAGALGVRVRPRDCSAHERKVEPAIYIRPHASDILPYA